MTTITRYPPNATTPLRRNRIQNPRMSTGSTAGWSSSTGAGAIAYSSVVGSALRFTTSASGVAVVETLVPVSPGEQMSFRAEVQPFTTARTALLRVYFTDSSFVNIGSANDNSAAAAVGFWQTLEVNGITAPANTAYARILVGISNSAGAGQAINVTRVMAVNGPVASTYFDGDSPNAYPFFYYWEGVRGLSASRFVDVTGGPDQFSPTDIVVPFRVSRQGRSVVRPLLESAQTKTVMIAAGPRTGTFELVPGGNWTTMQQLAFMSSAAIYYMVDESWATMWFAVTGDIEFNQAWGDRAQLTIPFTEVPAP